MPLASSTMIAMTRATLEPFAPSAIRTVNAPADHAPRYGTYAATKLMITIAPIWGRPRTQAPRPITTALKTATAVTPTK